MHCTTIQCIAYDPTCSLGISIGSLFYHLVACECGEPVILLSLDCPVHFKLLIGICGLERIERNYIAKRSEHEFDDFEFELLKLPG